MWDNVLLYILPHFFNYLGTWLCVYLSVFIFGIALMYSTTLPLHLLNCTSVVVIKQHIKRKKKILLRYTVASVSLLYFQCVYLIIFFFHVTVDSWTIQKASKNVWSNLFNATAMILARDCVCLYWLIFLLVQHLISPTWHGEWQRWRIPVR